MVEQRLPIVDSDDGIWGDILRQYLMKEHYQTPGDTDDPANGGHKTITVQPGTATAGTAPLKFTSGALMSTAEAGAIEFLTDTLYFTDTSGPTRKVVATYPVSGGAEGDVYYRDSSGVFTPLTIGNTDDVLTVSSGVPVWSPSGVASKLDSADFTNKARSAANLVVNADFEATSVGRTNYGSPVSPGYSTEQARSGTHSWKWTTPTLGSTSGIQFDLTDANISTNVTALVQSGDKFYISAWIYAHASNDHGSGGSMQLTCRFVDSTGVLSNSYQSETIALSSISLSTWTKLHVSLDTPNGYDQAVVFLTCTNSTPQGNIYYADDLVWQAVSVYREGGELEIFNTKDEETNYEKARHYWNSDVYTIATENGGTGNIRTMNFSANGKSLAIGDSGSGGWFNFDTSTSVNVAMLQSAGTWTHSSGTPRGLSISPTINQSSTAGYTALLVNPTHSTTGSGTKLLADFSLGGSQKVTIDTTGIINTAAAGTSAGDVATIDGTQTLTNKTLSSPMIDVINDTANDTTVAQIATWSGMAADRYIQLVGAPSSSGVHPYIAVDGVGTNLNIGLTPKGTGVISYYQPSGSTAGISVSGVATDIDFNIAPQGTGKLKASGIEVATISGTQTLTNKTLTDPRINSIKDTNGATSIDIIAEASAVNSLLVRNRATGNAPSIEAYSSVDTDVDLLFAPQGAGQILLWEPSNTWINMQVIGSQTNIDLNLIAKGSGVVKADNDGTAREVATVSGTQTLTNKTLTTPRIDYINDTTNGTAGLRIGADASAANYVYAWGDTTGNGAQVTVGGSDTNADLNLYGKGTGVVKANGSEVVTAATASRLVVSTQDGSTGTEDGANTWVKVVTYSTGTVQFADCTLTLSVTNNATGSLDTAIISVLFRSNTTSSNPTVDVKMIAKGGNGPHILNDSFKVISDGWSSDMELWAKKGDQWGGFNFYETSKNDNGGGTLTYTTNPAWQSSTPTGSVNNVSTNGVSSGLDLTVNGSVSTSGNATFGTATTGSTATPSKIDLTNNYGNNTPGNAGNLKLQLYSNYGLGLSGGLLEIQSGGSISSYAGGSEVMQWTSTGAYLVTAGTSSGAVVSVDDTQTLTNKTIAYSSNTITGLPYDMSIVAFGPYTARVASSYGDFAIGTKLPRAVTFTQVIYRCNSADASGNLVVEIRKNGSQVSGTSKTIAAADQTAGGANATATGSWSFSAGDVITIYVTGVGTTPGAGLIADIKGTA